MKLENSCSKLEHKIQFDVNLSLYKSLESCVDKDPINLCQDSFVLLWVDETFYFFCSFSPEVVFSLFDLIISESVIAFDDWLSFRLTIPSDDH